nr:hypothetical protein [Prevotella sp.]
MVRENINAVDIVQRLEELSQLLEVFVIIPNRSLGTSDVGF